MIFIKPLNPNVINPATNKKLSKDGIFIVKLDGYWKNRLSDNDIEIKKNKKGK